MIREFFIPRDLRWRESLRMIRRRPPSAEHIASRLEWLGRPVGGYG